MKGRILVDIHSTVLKSGDYAELDEKTAAELISLGAFDPDAPWPFEQEENPAMDSKTAARRKKKGQG